MLPYQNHMPGHFTSHITSSLGRLRLSKSGPSGHIHFGFWLSGVFYCFLLTETSVAFLRKYKPSYTRERCWAAKSRPDRTGQGQLVHNGLAFTEKTAISHRPRGVGKRPFSSWLNWMGEVLWKSSCLYRESSLLQPRQLTQPF